MDNRSSDEIELEKLNYALRRGVLEYEIGDRKIRYHSLKEMSDRQKQLRILINRRKKRIRPGGQNIPIGFAPCYGQTNRDSYPRY